MQILDTAARVVTETSYATTRVAGATGGALVGAVVGSMKGAVRGARSGISSGADSTPAAALTIGALGATGLATGIVAGPVLAALGAPR